jgi:hypothetical protein
MKDTNMKNTVNVINQGNNTYIYSFKKNGEDYSYTIKFDDSVVNFLVLKYDGIVEDAEQEMHDQIAESLMQMIT